MTRLRVPRKQPSLHHQHPQPPPVSSTSNECDEEKVRGILSSWDEQALPERLESIKQSRELAQSLGRHQANNKKFTPEQRAVFEEDFVREWATHNLPHLLAGPAPPLPPARGPRRGQHAKSMERLKWDQPTTEEELRYAAWISGQWEARALV
jgi:hypothetical protein